MAGQYDVAQARDAHGEGLLSEMGHKAMGAWARGAHVERPKHACDAGGVPVGYVRVEVYQIVEDFPHVGYQRGAPVGDGAVRRNGGSRVIVELPDRPLQEVVTLKGVLARAWRRRRKWRRRGRRR